MAINITIAQHATVGTTNLLATIGGAHIFNIKAGADRDNGSIVGLGAYTAPEYFAEGDSTAFTGKVIERAANGNWLIQVATATNAFLIATVPLVYEEYSNKFMKESNFYNASGSLMRGYELKPYDIFEVSAAGISGTIAKGAAVKVVSKKITIDVPSEG